jgi:hypothetical protein
MAGLVPAIHAVRLPQSAQSKHVGRSDTATRPKCIIIAKRMVQRDRVGGRDKPGHDGRRAAARP